MSTTANNSYNTFSFDTTVIPNASGNTINEGDMIYTDANYQATSLVQLANTSEFAGVAQNSYPVPNNYTNQPTAGILITRVGRVALLAKNGDTFEPYMAVWPAAIDAQTISATSGNAYPIGFVANLKDNSQRNFVGTGTNSILIDVRPNTTPKA